MNKTIYVRLHLDNEADQRAWDNLQLLCKQKKISANQGVHSCFAGLQRRYFTYLHCPRTGTTYCSASNGNRSKRITKILLSVHKRICF